MKKYEVHLESPVATSFRCTKAANSLDIDASKKSKHDFMVEADLDTDYNVGLIVGASGSGKTTLLRNIFGDDALVEVLDLGAPVMDQFPERYSYKECASMLAGVGLTSVPCWIRPAFTLSNGQRARAEAAIQLANIEDTDGVTVIDEWTSVVDRTVAKVMSHCISKHARKYEKQIILSSCHYDVIEWLNPDWVIDCNKQTYIDRRRLQRDFKRDERLQFGIREIDKSSWRYFSRYHYLTEKLPGGHVKFFGMYCGTDQIGFQCFANYVPHRPGTRQMMHSNRTVIHPDYAGLGLGIMLINETSAIMERSGYDVKAKFSSTPIYLSMKRQPCWVYKGCQRPTKVFVGGNMKRKASGGFRMDVKVYTFDFSLRRFEIMQGGDK